MPASFDNSGKPAYMYDEVGDTWYAFGAKIDTASAYQWTNTQTYLNTATFDATVNMLDGFNNFLNPAARDAAIPSPVHGTICFLRQDAGGNPINQIQYYNGSVWTANDGDISAVVAGTGLTGGGTAGSITLNVDTTVVATTNNTLTMSNKTLTSPTVSGLYLSDSSIIFEGTGGDDANETTLTVTNPTADRTITIPDVTGTVITTGDTGTVTNTMLAGSIANAKLANSTISGVSLGSNLNALTISTGLSGTSYNGSGAVTIAIDSTVATTSGTQTLTNKTLTSPTVSSPIFIGPEERWNIVAAAATGTIPIDVLTAGVWYYTSNASANHTLNFRGNSGTTLNSILNVGDSITIVWLNTNGGTAYYPNAFQIDGGSVTPRWSGGTAPTSGNASSVDAYSFTIVKTAATPSYTVLAAGAVKY